MSNVTVIEAVKIVERDGRTYVLPHHTKHNGPIDLMETDAYVILEGGQPLGGRLLRRESRG